jgi:hypothetical protein
MDLLGFATTFYPDEIKLVGQSYLEESTDEEIRALLKEKLLIDGDAASLLVERGFGTEVGLKNCKRGSGTSYERFVHKDFAPHILNDLEELGVKTDKYDLDLMENAIVVSRMLGPGASFSRPGMVLFENAFGGRIGIIPLSGLHGDLYVTDFRSWKRQYVLKKMLEWINRSPLPLFVEDAANVLPLRRDGENAILIGVANLSADPMPQILLQLAPPFEGKPVIEYLTSEGKRRLVDVAARRADGYLHLRIPVGVPPIELACFRLTKA